MANQFDGQWPILEPDEYQYSDFLQSFSSDTANQPFDQSAAYPNDEFFAYLPPYTDDSTTSLVSGLEVFEPPASSYRAPTTCPSSEPPASSFEGPEFLDRHVAGQQPPPPPPAMPSAGGCDDLRAPQLVDLQCIGGNPEIHVDAPVSWLPNHLQDDDLPMPLAPAAAEYAWPLPGLSGWDGDISPVGRQPLLRPPRDIFSQTRRTRSLAVPPTVNGPRSDPGVPSSSSSSSQPMARAHSMARGRSSNLSKEKRAKVALVRTTKACTHCRIRKREVSPSPLPSPPLDPSDCLVRLKGDDIGMLTPATVRLRGALPQAHEYPGTVRPRETRRRAPTQ